MGKVKGTYNGTANLIPIKKGQTDIPRLGGQTKSLQKRYAQQLRFLKQKGDTDTTIAWFCQRLEDPEANIIHIQKLLDRYIADNPEQLNGINTAIALHKAHFGEKHINQNLNVNIDLESEARELDDYIINIVK